VSVTLLTAYGSGTGLKSWSLNSIISNLIASDADKAVQRARRLLEIYGPYDNSKINFDLLIEELIYLVSEILYFRSQTVQAASSGFQMERIGSYAYQKFSNNGSQDLSSVIEGNSEIYAGILNLKQFPDKVAVSTRVITEALPGSDGHRPYTDTYIPPVSQGVMQDDALGDVQST
jgi:hypothetical protein